VGPRAVLDDVKKRKFLTLPGLELRPLDRPARSQSLYRLRCHGFYRERERERGRERVCFSYFVSYFSTLAMYRTI
jgi:hypothetical protein